MNLKNGDTLLASLDKENSKIVFEVNGSMIEKKPSEV
jgi:sulfur carrier protein ThiS